MTIPIIVLIIFVGLVLAFFIFKGKKKETKPTPWPTTTPPVIPKYLNKYEIVVPGNDLFMDGQELFITFTGFSGRPESLPIHSFMDLGTGNFFKTEICSTHYPIFKYGSAGEHIHTDGWVVEICSNCCNK